MTNSTLATLQIPFNPLFLTPTPTPNLSTDVHSDRELSSGFQTFIPDARLGNNNGPLTALLCT